MVRLPKRGVLAAVVLRVESDPINTLLRKFALDAALTSKIPQFAMAVLFRTFGPAVRKPMKDGNAPVFIESPRQVSRNGGFVIGMRYHHQDVRLVAFVGLRQWFGLLRIRWQQRG